MWDHDMFQVKTCSSCISLAVKSGIPDQHLHLCLGAVDKRQLNETFLLCLRRQWGNHCSTKYAAFTVLFPRYITCSMLAHHCNILNHTGTHSTSCNTMGSKIFSYFALSVVCQLCVKVWPSSCAFSFMSVASRYSIVLPTLKVSGSPRWPGLQFV